MREINLFGGMPGATYEVASTDAAQSIATAKKYLDGASVGKARGALISVKNNYIMFSFTTDPTTSLGHPANAGERILLDSWQQVDDFKFISAIAGLAATLAITILF